MVTRFLLILLAAATLAVARTIRIETDVTLPSGSKTHISLPFETEFARLPDSSSGKAVLVIEATTNIVNDATNVTYALSCPMFSVEWPVRYQSSVLKAAELSGPTPSDAEVMSLFVGRVMLVAERQVRAQHKVVKP